MPIYRIENKVIFFSHIPKTAGSSIEYTLRSYGREALNDYEFLDHTKSYSMCSAQHYHAKIMNRIVRPGFFDFIFAVTRNPYDRLFSEFRYRLQIRAERKTMKYGSTLEAQELNVWVEQQFKAYKEDKFTLDNHIRPQHEFISEDTNVFRFEQGIHRIFRVLSRVCEQDMVLSESKLMQSPEIQLHVTQDTIDKIVDFYALDFERLGYDHSFKPNKARAVAFK